MARARNIKPSFFQNDELGELDPLARLAFIGMWTIADFKGCIEYRPKMLKVQLLPYDECDIELITNNLDKARFIRFYSVQGKRYIKIVNFEKHQNPHKNEKEAGSAIPDITEHDEELNINNELTQDGTKPDLIGTARADSLLLNPSSSISTSQPNARDPQKFAMHIGWQPSEEFPTLAKMAMVAMPDGKLGEFIAHWRTDPTIQRTQAEWDKSLLQSCQHDKLRKASPNPPKGKPQPENFANKDYGTGVNPL